MKHVEPSKGKREKKRKRAAREIEPNSPPPMPEIYKSLTIGFNSTNRALESMIRQPAVPGQPGESCNAQKLTVVFVDQATQSSILHSRLPLLVASASLANKDDPQIRLVSLPRNSESRLLATLNVPRAGIIGIAQDATGAQPLLDFIFGHSLLKRVWSLMCRM